MAFTIDLPPDLEAWLEREAARRGLTANVFAEQLLEISRLKSTLTLDELSLRCFESDAMGEAWIQAATEAWARMTPEERVALEAEDKDFLDSLNESRRLAGQYRML
jgi:hypothetical protein